MRKTPFYLLGLTIVFGFFATLLINAQSQEPMKTETTAPAQPQQSITLTDAEWKEKLSSEEYRIARKGGTEAPNGKIYKQFKDQGTGAYFCTGCDAELFSSVEKFDSRSGWPSFYEPSNAKNVKLLTDSDGRRTEVKCAICDAHLGHVFRGEGFNTPTDKRYCINGTVLKFVPDAEKKMEAKEESK